jgi:hypothetical protein
MRLTSSDEVIRVAEQVAQLRDPSRATLDGIPLLVRDIPMRQALSH